MAGLYVHIPLCKQRCIYCDFYSTTHSGWVDDYLSALHKEALHRSHEIEPHDISTLYIGGGTPSQLTLPQLSLLVEELRDVFDLSGL
ncbi:MAG: coproporphyrinogen III oxidase, partial [Muribaculaceae bacterium]|nr:coproporphyrinogen III oxidase [Muribaculaceae bacterium]